MISWNHPTNITYPVPSCRNASPLVLFLPKIRWSSSDLPRVLPGVDRWSLTRWLHPHSKMAPSPIFAVSQETRLWSSLRSSVVSLDNLPSNCSVNSSKLQVIFWLMTPKEPFNTLLSAFLGSLSLYRGSSICSWSSIAFQGRGCFSYSCISFLKVLWPSGLCHSMFQSYRCPPLLNQLPKTHNNTT